MHSQELSSDRDTDNHCLNKFDDLQLIRGSLMVYTTKNIRRFYGKIFGNRLPVYLPLFLREPVFSGIIKHNR